MGWNSARRYLADSVENRRSDHKKDIKRDYIVIGNVNEPVKDGQDADDAIERLKVKARKLGGDALFNLRKESVMNGAITKNIG